MLNVIEFFDKDQSELDSRELDSPLSSSSDLEEELQESELPSVCHKQCGACVLCSIVCLLPFLPTPSILKAKIGVRGYNVVAFCAGARLDRGAKERTYGTLQNDICNTGTRGCRCAEGVGEKKMAQTKKGSENPDSYVI